MCRIKGRELEKTRRDFRWQYRSVPYEGERTGRRMGRKSLSLQTRKSQP